MATPMVRDPFADVRSLMRRTFDDPFFSGTGFGARRPARNGQHKDQQTGLALNVFETDEGLTVEAPLPGFSKDEVNVTVEQGKLTIRAEHAEESSDEGESEGRRYFVREQHWGSVSRSLLIGEKWDGEQVSGSLENGVLHLRIPRSKEAEPHTVEIS